MRWLARNRSVVTNLDHERNSLVGSGWCSNVAQAVSAPKTGNSQIPLRTLYVADPATFGAVAVRLSCIMWIPSWCRDACRKSQPRNSISALVSTRREDDDPTCHGPGAGLFRHRHRPVRASWLHPCDQRRAAQPAARRTRRQGRDSSVPAPLGRLLLGRKSAPHAIRRPHPQEQNMAFTTNFGITGHPG